MQRICCLKTLARVCVSLCVIMASYVAAHATSSRTTPKAKSATSTCGTSNYDGSTAAVLGSSVPTRENSAAKTQASRPRLSDRVRNTEPAHIEAVLSRYAGMHPKPANLAQGVAHWDPPLAALNEITQDEDERQGTGLADSSYHKYGPALGLPALREALIGKLMKENGLDMTDQELMVTAGGNQAFAMVSLALLDPGDRVLLARPFYCAHQCAVQLAGGSLVECGWDPSTLLPDMAHLKREIERGVKMVVITTPGNPTGAVCPQEMLDEIARLCSEHGTWLVVDEAYEHFLFDSERHYSPCGNRLRCPDNIIHLFTMSKSFGLAGWRVGYAVYPAWASEDMVKIQDTLPTHACTASQRIALAALEGGGCDWARSKVASLTQCREAMWSAVRDMGGVRGDGAFYFLIPVPTDEDRAIEVLAKGFGVLVTPGRAFGAPGHIRVSYGSLPERECLAAIERLRDGLQALAQEANGDSSP